MRTYTMSASGMLSSSEELTSLYLAFVSPVVGRAVSQSFALEVPSCVRSLIKLVNYRHKFINASPLNANTFRSQVKILTDLR